MTETRLRLRLELERAGIPQGVFADAVGWSRSEIRKILNTQTPASLDFRAAVKAWAVEHLPRNRRRGLFSVVRVPVNADGSIAGAKLKMLLVLDAREITLGDVERGTRIARSSISMISRGIQKPTPDQAKRIERFLIEKHELPPETVARIWERANGELRGGASTTLGLIEREEITMLDEEVLAHFGLRQDPFRCEIAGIGDLFKGKNYAAAERDLLEAARRKEFVALVGEVGVGKTVVMEGLRVRLKRESRFRLLIPPSPSRETMHIRSVEESLIRSLAPKATVRNSIDSRARQLKGLLNHALEEEQICVALIDEAHALPNQTIKAFKRLLELAGFERLLGIILLGQPELEGTLRDPGMREVGRRCRRIEIEGLARSEVGPYLEHKIQRAGGKRLVFDGGAIATLKRQRKDSFDRWYTHARIPLALGNKAALAMEIAQEMGAPRVKAAHVEIAFSGKPKKK